MKILVVYRHYGSVQFCATDVAESLVKEGSEVTALCGLPNYPQAFLKVIKMERIETKIIMV